MSKRKSKQTKRHLSERERRVAAAFSRLPNPKRYNREGWTAILADVLATETSLASTPLRTFIVECARARYSPGKFKRLGHAALTEVARDILSHFNDAADAALDAESARRSLAGVSEPATFDQFVIRIHLVPLLHHFASEAGRMEELADDFKGESETRPFVELHPRDTSLHMLGAHPLSALDEPEVDLTGEDQIPLRSQHPNTELAEEIDSFIDEISGELATSLQIPIVDIANTMHRCVELLEIQPTSPLDEDDELTGIIAFAAAMITQAREIGIKDAAARHPSLTPQEAAGASAASLIAIVRSDDFAHMMCEQYKRLIELRGGWPDDLPL